jgi:hypothetical protein
MHQRVGRANRALSTALARGELRDFVTLLLISVLKYPAWHFTSLLGGGSYGSFVIQKV